MKLTLWLTTAATLFAAGLGNNPVPVHDVTVHEWGTFTSVADAYGDPLVWAPLNGKPDLPCFVERLPQAVKYQPGTIRMETPVIYFYAQQPTTLDVRVEFPNGKISEWYPAPTGRYEGKNIARWDWNVQILPGADLAFPMGESPTHYYTARETDAAPLRVTDQKGNVQQEKMIFYRGIGSFEPALRPRYLADGRIELRNAGELPIAAAIVFENRDGRVGYRMVRDLRDTISVDAPALIGSAADVRTYMQRELQTMGMFEKEAIAMVETWRDSWFEPGTRVFYFVPPADVDKVLPLTISPAPASVARAFVGRVEMLSPATRELVSAAVATNDQATMQRMGRFLQPFAEMMNLRLPQQSWKPEGLGCVE